MTEDDFKPYSRPDQDSHPGAIVERLLDHEEHNHIRENDITIEYLLVHRAKRKQGKRIVGAVHLPTVQGQLKDLFEMLVEEYFGMMPDYLMIIDSAWWGEADDTQKEALVWHELCHVKQEIDEFGSPKFDMDGNPKYGLREHDVAAFNSEVSRYGAWSPDLQQFVQSIKK